VNAGIEERSNNKSDDDSEELIFADTPDVKTYERQEIPMPELIEGSEYLVAFLHSAGTATANGMGLSGLSWQELESWVRCTDNVGIVTPKDLKILHQLSRVYANESAVASKKGAVAPYIPVLEEEDVEEIRDIVEEKTIDVFEQMMSASKRD
jgi:hypothetical protein